MGQRLAAPRRQVGCDDRLEVSHLLGTLKAFGKPNCLTHGVFDLAQPAKCLLAALLDGVGIPFVVSKERDISLFN